MPLYYYQCVECLKPHRKILTPEEAKRLQACECGYTLRRTPRPPTAQSVETLDNGAMTKSLERLTDAERLFSERNEAVKKQQGGE